MRGAKTPRIVFRGISVLFYLRNLFTEYRFEKKGQSPEFNSDNDNYGGYSGTYRRIGRLFHFIQPPVRFFRRQRTLRSLLCDDNR